MFWGLVLKANRKYTQTTSKSFHISQAALDSSSSIGEENQLFITFQNQKVLICTLHKDTYKQVSLDLNFAVGDKISFQILGDGMVHLSGYLTDLEDDYAHYEEEDSEIEFDLKKIVKNNKAVASGISSKRGIPLLTNDENDGYDDDKALSIGNREDRTGDDFSIDDNKNDDEMKSEEQNDDKLERPKSKKLKLDKYEQNGLAVKSETWKTNLKDIKEVNQVHNSNSGKILIGGVIIQDLKIGSGAELKSGKRAQVFYEGRLKSSNKVFDCMKKGNGFKFRVGRGEVIKGWDVGVVGMKVGGKRRITCPPHMAYGARGSTPHIPPNSTLLFEVELKEIH